MFFSSGKLLNKKNISSVSILHFYFLIAKIKVWKTWGIPNLHILKKNQYVDAKSAQHLHILKKIKSFDSEKSPNLHILKKIKNIKNLRFYVRLTGIDELVFDFFDFFEYMQGWWFFTIKTFDFFEYMQVLCTFGINMLIFFEYMQLWWTSSPLILHILKKNKYFDREKLRTCIYSKKINILMPKAHKTCIYSKKSKLLIMKSHQPCIYSKKSKKSKTNSSMPVSRT